MAKSGMFGSSQGDESKTQTYASMLTPKQKKYFNTALDTYGSQLGKNNVYQGERVAGFDPLQKSVFDFAQGGGFVTSPEQMNNYYRDVLKNPAMTNYSENTMPAVKEAFSGPGYWGSARASEEVKANKNLNDYLNEAYGKLNWDTMLANREGAQQQFELGSTAQQQSQNEINAQMQKFTEENQITDPDNLQILMSLLGMNVEQSGQNRSAVTTPSWKTGDWLNFGAQAAGLFL